MSTPARRFAIAGLAALLAVAAAFFALASSHATSPAGAAALKPALTGSGENLTNGKRGGTLTVYDSEDFEHLDPGSAYFALDYEVIYATQMTLYAYKPNNTQVAAPLLASGQPIVSNGGKTVTVHIQGDVHYSPPLDRAVTSADVKYAIERGANPNVGNGYFQAYFSSIVGAAKATGGPISGITTPNATTIVFHLTEPDSALLIGALSLPLSAPVPESFAGPLDKDKPTQYGTSSEEFTGPYMLEATKTGKFLGLGYNPGKNAVLVRNPNWNPKTDPAPAYLDRININIGGATPVIGRQVLTGSDSLQNDTPDSSIVQLAYTKYYKQLVVVPGAGTHYISLNNAKGALSNVWVRRAVYAAMDRDAYLKIRGGAIVGNVGTHFITPGTSGFAQAGGYAGPNYPWNDHPSGDVALAETYMKKAGYPSGKYTGSQVIKIVDSNNGDDPAIGAVVKDAFSELGFTVNLALVDQSVVYSKYCGVPAAEIDSCPSVGWIRDFNNPLTILFVPFDGTAIVPTNNSNWGQVNDPAINAAMAKAAVAPASQQASAWAKVDDMLVDDAAAIPGTFDKQPNIESANVRGINDLWDVGEWDYAYTSLDNP
jgi:peptide/nickel transport system substrate-binding protein